MEHRVSRCVDCPVTPAPPALSAYYVVSSVEHVLVSVAIGEISSAALLISLSIMHRLSCESSRLLGY